MGRRHSDRWEDVINAHPFPEDAASRRLRQLAQQWQQEQRDDRHR